MMRGVISRISAITLKVKDMEKSCKFYEKLPGFKLKFGGTLTDSFTTFALGGGAVSGTINYLNLELERNYDDDDEDDVYIDANLPPPSSSALGKRKRGGRGDFGRIIFHTDDVDGLYQFMKADKFISEIAIFETQPTDAPWGERFFHVRDPDGYQLSFAKPIQ
jgi:catechol 2,3-dioxygenase-like lactoylglutathione lyase family enzyme